MKTLHLIKKHCLIVSIIIIVILFLLIPYILKNILNNCDSSLADYYGSMLGSLVAFCGVILSLWFSKYEIRKEKINDLLNSLHVKDYENLINIVTHASHLNDKCLDVMNSFNNVYYYFNGKHSTSAEIHYIGNHKSYKDSIHDVINKANFIIKELYSFKHSDIVLLKQIIKDKFFYNYNFNNKLMKDFRNYENALKALKRKSQALRKTLDFDYIDKRLGPVDYAKSIELMSKNVEKCGRISNKIGSQISNQLNNLKSLVVNSITNY